MSQPLQQKNTRLLLKWLPVVMLAGSIFFYFLLRGHILHMQQEQLRLKQTNVLRAFRAAGGSLPLQIPGEYDIKPAASPGSQARELPRDSIISFTGSTPETFTLLTSSFMDNGKPYLITTYISSREFTHLMIKIALAEALIFALLLAAVFTVNRKASSRLWAPFYTTMRSIRNYNIRQHEGPLLSADTGVEEFDRLNQTLGSLIDNVEQAYRSQKQFTENAAHELQTPLAIIRSKVELLIEGAELTEDSAQLLGEISDANERLSQMSRNLLTLARIENRQYPAVENVDLSALVEKQGRVFGSYYETAVRETKTDIEPGVQLTVNLSLMEILVNNLLRNAYIHNLPGGYVRICLRRTELVVENSGPPLEGAPARMFDRFTKGREDARTTGLGLSLVQQICELYHFDLTYCYRTGVHLLRVGLVPPFSGSGWPTSKFIQNRRLDLGTPKAAPLCFSSPSDFFHLAPWRACFAPR